MYNQQDVFAAGSETSATALEWAMSELIRNPDVMRKAQTEVTEVLLGAGAGSRQTSSTTPASMSATSAQGGGGGEGEFEEVIRSKLRYLELVIKETLRLHPPVPLLLPRECQKSCQVMGYHIPAKARVMVNVWAIGRDPTYWSNPEAFCPERFAQDSPVDFKGAHFEFTPFGAGRRICPGMQFGLATLELALANLLYYFDWEHSGEEGEELDMTDSFGLTARRRFPLRLRAIPRAI